MCYRETNNGFKQTNFDKLQKLFLCLIKVPFYINEQGACSFNLIKPPAFFS